MNSKIIVAATAVALSFSMSSCMLHTISGVVTDASMHTITVQTPKKEHYTFSTVDAKKKAPDGIVLEDKAKIQYKGEYKKDEVNMATKLTVKPGEERKQQLKQTEKEQTKTKKEPAKSSKTDKKAVNPGNRQAGS